jgi:hypothetical protein
LNAVNLKLKGNPKMTDKSNTFRLFLPSIFCMVLFYVFVVSVVVGQGGQNGDGSRQIFAEEFTRSRPAKSKSPAANSNTPASSKSSKQRKPNSTVTANSRQRYRRITPSPSSTVPASAAKLGVTIWRLRSVQSADKGARLLVQGDENELVAERVGADVELHVRDRVRLTIESPREGYLYVVDRELYADGSMGEPYLIFPTLRTHGGDNRVRAGKLIDIPAQEDNPNYFTLIPSPDRQDQVGETLSIIVTSEPLENFEKTSKPIKLSAAQVEKWQTQWGTRVEQFELDGGAGMTWSNEEKEASAEGTARLLTQEDPSPQIIYLVDGKNDKGLLITVPLRYGR